MRTRTNELSKDRIRGLSVELNASNPTKLTQPNWRSSSKIYSQKIRQVDGHSRAVRRLLAGDLTGVSVCHEILGVSVSQKARKICKIVANGWPTRRIIKIRRAMRTWKLLRTSSAPQLRSVGCGLVARRTIRSRQRITSAKATDTSWRVQVPKMVGYLGGLDRQLRPARADASWGVRFRAGANPTRPDLVSQRELETPMCWVIRPSLLIDQIDLRVRQTTTLRLIRAWRSLSSSQVSRLRSAFWPSRPTCPIVMLKFMTHAPPSNYSSNSNRAPSSTKPNAT